jgi:L-alanine-DL-glutamate epimerase-like enolase superfamily enzyme
MIVYVAFKFDGVDPDSPEADEIVREITESCETMQIGFDANNCWVEDAVFDKEEK